MVQLDPDPEPDKIEASEEYQVAPDTPFVTVNVMVDPTWAVVPPEILGATVSCGFSSFLGFSFTVTDSFLLFPYAE